MRSRSSAATSATSCIVRVGNENQLTDLGQMLRPRARDVVANAQRLFNLQVDFDPAHSDREFAVGASDYIIMRLMPALSALLRQHAPDVRIRFIQAGPEFTADPLGYLRTIDVLIVPVGLIADIPHVNLMKDRWVLVISETNKLVSEQPTVEELTSVPWVLTHHRRGGPATSVPHLRAAGVDPVGAFLTDSFLTLPVPGCARAIGSVSSPSGWAAGSPRSRAAGSPSARWSSRRMWRPAGGTRSRSTTSGTPGSGASWSRPRSLSTFRISGRAYPGDPRFLAPVPGPSSSHGSHRESRLAHCHYGCATCPSAWDRRGRPGSRDGHSEPLRRRPVAGSSSRSAGPFRDALRRTLVSKLRVGIIGLGFIGTAKHLPGLAAVSDDVDVVAFCDLVEERAQKARDGFGSADAYVTTDWHRVVDDPTIDVIHVCTWNVSHCELTCAALEAGKHVLCEKPMAVTGEEARLMLATAEADRPEALRSATSTASARRCSSCASRSTRDSSARSTTPGPMRSAGGASRSGAPSPTRASRVAVPLIDLGTHALDLALWYMGNYEVESVTGQIYDKLQRQARRQHGGPLEPGDLRGRRRPRSASSG